MDTRRPIPKNNIIDLPGHYEIESDMIFRNSDFAISIQSDNVLLDLKGYTLSYEGTPSVSNKGILVTTKKDIHIINGRLRNFYFGIVSTGIQNLLIENITLESIKYIGINAEGKNLHIQNNVIKDLDFNFPKFGTSNYLVGINIHAKAGMLINNRIETTVPYVTDSHAAFELVGILIGARSTGLTILCNELYNSSSDHMKNYAIWAGKDTQAAIMGNIFKNYYYDIASSNACNIYFSNNKVINDETYFHFIQKNIVESYFNSAKAPELEQIKSYLGRSAFNNSLDNQSANISCPS